MTEGSGSTERVVSQLLTEMDGIQPLANVIVLAATNRIDMIDTSLLRSGRFDKPLYIGPPDLAARKIILEIHAKGKPVPAGLDIGRIAEMTDRFSGADVAAVMNTAMSLLVQEYLSLYPKPADALSHVSEAILTMKHFEDAVHKIKTSREGNPWRNPPFRTTDKCSNNAHHQYPSKYAIPETCEVGIFARTDESSYTFDATDEEYMFWTGLDAAEKDTFILSTSGRCFFDALHEFMRVKRPGNYLESNALI